jgi:phage anti-repressor protein
MKKTTLQVSDQDIATKTPIEIALQIDEDGMTTASNLYTFLELEPTHFSRWCTTNIKNNKFAIENEDYIPLAINGERNNPKPRTDYKITSDFAKKLSMTGNTEKHEQARQYFLACEQGLKIATQKMKNNISEDKLASAIDNMSATLSSINARLTALEEQSNKRKLPEKKYSRWKTNTFDKLNTLLSYVNTHSSEILKLSEIIHLVIAETEDTYGIEINDYVRAYQSEFELDTSPYVIDVIDHYKDIRDIFSLILDSIMEKLHIEEKQTSHKRNIFDELATKLDTEQKEEIHEAM